MRSVDLVPALAVSAYWAPAVLAAAAACSDVVLPVPDADASATARGVAPAGVRGRGRGLSERRVRVAFRRIVRRLEAEGWPA